MIALTSHRPHARSVEFARNQALAKRTWEGVFTRIIYAGPEEPELTSPKTEFRKAEDWPRIQTLAEIAANQGDYVALLNADICVNDRMKHLRNQMLAGGAMCASSRRYHFDPHNPDWANAKLIDSDRGRDIFIARPYVWQRVASLIPIHLRIGHQQWDAWVSDYFRDTYGKRFRDFTNLRCIFHPIHGDRQMPFAEQIVERQAA